MFDVLMRRADELRGELFEVMSPYVQQRVVQGALLEIDERWLNWWGWHYAGPAFPIDWPTFEFRVGDAAAWLSEFHRPLEFDFQKLPHWWPEHCRDAGYPDEAEPLRVRIILRQSATIGPTGSLESNLPSNLGKLPIVYELRPPLVGLSVLSPLRTLARLLGGSAASSTAELPSAQFRRSLSVGRQRPNPSAGTIGAFMRDTRTSQRFVLSCAHVLGPSGTTIYAPGPFENRGLNEIGQVVWSELPDLKANGTACNMFDDPVAGRIDAALVKLNTDSDDLIIGARELRLTGVFSPKSMTPTQTVKWIGKESGCHRGTLGACTIWHEIEFDDGPRCFSQLFEIISPAAQDVWVRPGDSGSCVIDAATGQRGWMGIIVAAHRDRAYACFARTVLDQIKSSLYPHMAVDT